jgi:glycosyltransferase involved in cell wall biosynthesis
MTPNVSIVVPAHNEEAVIGRLLNRLLESVLPGELDVVVVANGCTDRTAAVAGSFGSGVRVVDRAIPSKREALRVGDNEARSFPRLYVDADVELGTADVRRLCEAVSDPGILAAAPEREFDMARSRWAVRWYYDVWTRLPEVRRGLFGRGVLAVSDAGHRRIAALPPVMADDLAVSLAFADNERAVVSGATVLIRPPRTWVDLLRRRVRAEIGTSQLEREGAMPSTSARTSPSDLLRLVRLDPLLALRMPVFLIVAALARLGAHRAKRRGDFSTWLRDESSRQS